MLSNVISKLKSFFRKSQKFKPTNALETMIADKVHETDPRRFFELFRNREILLVVVPGNVGTADGSRNGEDVKIILSDQQLAGVRFAYAYTSAEALSFNITARSLNTQTVARLNGLKLLETIEQVGCGLSINMGHEELLLLGPNEVKHVLKELRSPTQVTVTRHGYPQGTNVFLGNPNVMPVKKLNSLVEFLKQNPRIEKITFCLMCVEPGKNPEYSYLLGLCPTTGQVDLEEVAGDIGRLWSDVKEDSENFRDYAVEVHIVSPEDAEREGKMFVTITRGGWVNGQQPT